ncbi:hypothetical protein SAMN04487846_2847 [Microbacterium sp. cf046]|uniref:hypothetical protein n=1 Tax=Microbacterium sp. cf046 TaxID=1761803 RepID=UPI0008F06162|nr:hypothetical protein [Microbacterium sp. cf046]SFS14098.1 hypothetical protein SAMN04487846_2847 [Microbacterium sp. cf046]
MDLPLLLAGPILRRVEPNLVAVWVALSEMASVRLSVWEGLVAAGTPGSFANSVDDAGERLIGDDGEETLRVGDRLYLTVATIRLAETSGKQFASDSLYSYDLTFKVSNGPRAGVHTLKSLGLLEPKTEAREALIAPLGYKPNQLPSFAPCPSAMGDLRVVYGSCRKPGHGDPDAMVWIDDLLAKDDTWRDPRARPHELFLGGDQIYADDVETLQMLRIIELGRELIGTMKTLSDGREIDTSRERIPVDHIRSRRADVDFNAEHPLAAYEEPVAGRRLLPIDREHFPALWRLDLVQRAAQLTTTDGVNHLLSVGEFAATYLLSWSPACWGDEIPDATLQDGETADKHQLLWTDEVRPGSVITLPPLAAPAEIAGDLFVEETDEKPETEEQKQKDEAKRQKGLRRSHRILKEFRAGLAKVQRVLANVPTYMILDDHDVTDDLFLNPLWRERVLKTALGHAVMTNAMIAYALFQDWGNDPRRYDRGLRAELLGVMEALFPDGPDLRGPKTGPYDRCAELFGHDQLNVERLDGRYSPVTPPIRWDFMVDGPKHRVLVLDNRTRRSYGSRLGPPGNVSIEAMLDQIPPPPLRAGQEILVVVAPLVVLGPPVLDDVIAPLTYRAYDLKDSLSSKSVVTPNSRTGHRGMIGTDPDAIESWAADPVTFEALLARLATYQRVVLLSGDVHNASGTLMSYWSGATNQPARIAQFVSSGFKNVMPSNIAAASQSLGFAQQLLRANLGTERLAWAEPKDDMVVLPDGLGTDALTPGLRAKLARTPVLVPSWGWPDETPENQPAVDATETTRLNPAQLPDWRWRLTPLLDQRPDELRPEPMRPLALDEEQIEAQLSDPERLIDAYQAIAVRHQHALGHLRNARQILFRSNFGLCRFEPHPDGTMDAVHEVYTAFVDPDDPTATDDPEPAPYLVQRAPLGPEDEPPPDRLRARVIDRRARLGKIEQPGGPA